MIFVSTLVPRRTFCGTDLKMSLNLGRHIAIDATDEPCVITSVRDQRVCTADSVIGVIFMFMLIFTTYDGSHVRTSWITPCPM